MANEISLASTSGATLYAVARDRATGQYLVGVTPEAFVAAHWATCAVAMTEVGSSGQYFADFPAAPAGDYVVDVYRRAGGSPATSDGPPIASSTIAWTGTAPASLAALVAALSGLPRPLTGTVAASPAPTATAFTVTFSPPLDAGTVNADLVGLYAKSGGGPRQAAERKVSAAAIASMTSARLTVTPPFAAAVVAGESLSIF